MDLCAEEISYVENILSPQRTADSLLCAKVCMNSRQDVRHRKKKEQKSRKLSKGTKQRMDKKEI